MKLEFDSHMGAIHAALKQAKTLDEKMLVILKYDKNKHKKKIRVSGKTYSWK
jgi:glycerol-3-phosphate cytidylyltransferase-like family protein